MDRRIDDLGAAGKGAIRDGTVGSGKIMVEVKQRELRDGGAAEVGDSLPAYSRCGGHSEKQYSSILASTLEKLEGVLREDEGNLSLNGAVAPGLSKDTETLRSLSLADLDKIQTLWKTDPGSVEKLKSK